MWYFQNIFIQAKDKLSNMAMDAAKKVALGREHNISAWFESGLCDLVTGNGPPPLQKCQSIGFSTTVAIFHSLKDTRVGYGVIMI